MANYGDASCLRLPLLCSMSSIPFLSGPRQRTSTVSWALNHQPSSTEGHAKRIPAPYSPLSNAWTGYQGSRMAARKVANADGGTGCMRPINGGTKKQGRREERAYVGAARHNGRAAGLVRPWLQSSGYKRYLPSHQNSSLPTSANSILVLLKSLNHFSEALLSPLLLQNTLNLPLCPVRE